MSNIDVVGNLLQKVVRKDTSSKVIDMKKIFNNYKGKKTKKKIPNPYQDLDPKSYNIAKHKENLLSKMNKGY